MGAMSRIFTSVALAASSLLIAACAGARPRVELPEPTGVHAVGVTTATLVDETRVDPLGPKDSPRHLTVTAWYPAEPTGSETPASMLLDLEADDIRSTMRLMGLPGSTADAMAEAPGHAWVDAPRSTAKERWPVLLFSHGFVSAPQFYTGTATELASHGYVVVSINHPYESAAARVAPSEVIGGKLARFALRVTMQMRGIDDLAELSAGPEKLEATRELLERNDILDGSLRVWLDDSRFVLDQLETLDDSGLLAPLHGGLDMERLGALGHSFGGATAIALSLEDDRVDAAINIDGFQFGEVLGRKIPVPSMLIESAQLPGANDMVYAASPDLQKVTLEHVLHLGASDLGYVAGLPERKYQRLVGTGPVRDDLRTIDRLVLDHMDRWVAGTEPKASPAVTPAKSSVSPRSTSGRP